VMGWSDVSFDSERWESLGVPPGGTEPEPVPAYSSDIAASWQVVERLRTLGWSATIELLPDEYPLAGDRPGADAGHRVPVVCTLAWLPEGSADDTWKRLYHQPEAIADTAPHALCLAALAGVQALLEERS